MTLLKSGRRVVLLLAALVALTSVVSGCQAGAAATPTPAPTAVPVPPAGKVVWNGTYAKNIQPIFNDYCVKCHGPSLSENGLRLDSYAGVMKGTQYGAVIVPGSPSTSALVSVIQGTAAASIQMPHGAKPLASQDVQNIILWIQAGAPND